MGTWPQKSLAAVGITTAEDAAMQTDEYLLELKGVSKATVDKIREWERGRQQDLHSVFGSQLAELGTVELWGISPVNMAFELLRTMVEQNKKICDDYVTSAWAAVRLFTAETVKGL